MLRGGRKNHCVGERSCFLSSKTLRTPLPEGLPRPEFAPVSRQQATVLRHSLAPCCQPSRFLLVCRTAKYVVRLEAVGRSFIPREIHLRSTRRTGSSSRLSVAVNDFVASQRAVDYKLDKQYSYFSVATVPAVEAVIGVFSRKWRCSVTFCVLAQRGRAHFINQDHSFY